MRAAWDAFGSLIDGRAGGGSADLDDSASHTLLRTVFISDIHLGTPGCQAEALLDFLKHHRCDNLYLVGDIDGRLEIVSWSPRNVPSTLPTERFETQTT